MNSLTLVSSFSEDILNQPTDQLTNQQTMLLIPVVGAWQRLIHGETRPSLRRSFHPGKVTLTRNETGLVDSSAPSAWMRTTDWLTDESSHNTLTSSIDRTYALAVCVCFLVGVLVCREEGLDFGCCVDGVC